MILYILLVFWKHTRWPQLHYFDVWLLVNLNILVAVPAAHPAPAWKYVVRVMASPWEKWSFGLAEGLQRSLLTAGKGWPDILFQTQTLKGYIFLVVHCLTPRVVTSGDMAKLLCVLASPFACCWCCPCWQAATLTSCAAAWRLLSSGPADLPILHCDLKLFSACNYYNENTKEIDSLYSSHYITLDSCPSAKGLNMIHVIYFLTNHLFNYLLELEQKRPKKERGGQPTVYVQ